jgi:integrase
MHAVEAVLPLVSPQVAALIRLQLLTGARPGELLALRARELDTSAQAGGGRDGVWAFRPRAHKNAHRGRERVIYLGPAAQGVLAEFMAGRPVDAYLFSPAEAEEARRAELHRRRRTQLSCGNRPGSARRESPVHQPGPYYTTASYRRAIQRACDLAFPPPDRLRPRVVEGGRRETEEQFEARLTPRERAELRAWREKHRWHPHQLRHTAATRIRREFGLEAAQLVLGHASAAITDAVYAERDLSKVADVIRRVG